MRNANRMGTGSRFSLAFVRFKRRSHGHDHHMSMQHCVCCFLYTDLHSFAGSCAGHVCFPAAKASLAVVWLAESLPAPLSRLLSPGCAHSSDSFDLRTHTSQRCSMQCGLVGPLLVLALLYQVPSHDEHSPCLQTTYRNAMGCLLACLQPAIGAICSLALHLVQTSRDGHAQRPHLQQCLPDLRQPAASCPTASASFSSSCRLPC